MGIVRDSTGRWRRTRSLLIGVCGTLIAVSLVFGVAGCGSDSTKAVVSGASSDNVTWTGNGSSNNCPYGGSLHWILTPGGNATLLSGTLHVQFSDGTSGNFGGYFQGQGSGAMHFDSVGDASVTSANADFTYTGTLGNVVLTISHSTCNTTTTSGGSTTTLGGSTTTAVGGITSTTATTVGGTTSTLVGGLTTVPGPSTTLVGGVTSTAGRIDTGAGGTAGPNVMMWLIVALLGGLALALGGSAVWSVVKHKDGHSSR